MEPRLHCRGPHRLARRRPVPCRENVSYASSDGSAPSFIRFADSLIVAAVGLRLSPSIASLVSTIPLQWLVAAQIYRIAGGIFLVLWPAATCPGNSRCPQGLGTSSPRHCDRVAILLARKAAGARRAACAWSVFRIADLVVAVTMGTLTSPSFPHLLAHDAPNVLITSYPLVIVPTFAVPLA